MTESAPESGPESWPAPVYVNGRFLAQRQTGVQRAAAELVTALDGLLSSDGRSPLTVLAPPDADTGRLRLDGTTVRRIGRCTGYAWEQWELPRAAGGSLLINLGNTAPLLHRRNAILIHDASVFDRPDGYGWKFRTAMRWLLPVLARRAEALFTVSRFSADRLAAHGIANRHGCTVLPSGTEHVARLAVDGGAPARHGLEPGRYVLFVGSPHPNKNLAGALAAIGRVGDPGLRLAVVGAADPRVFAADAPAAARPGDRAVFLGAVDDAEMAGLYAGALALLFPSYYEGSGLPPLEAMALGCPVIASDRASIPEVCGDAARLVDPDDPADMAAAIDRLAADDPARDDLIARGHARAGLFTWRAAAERLAATLGLAGRPTSRASD
ncbi:MAG: glycosyltransferase family 1 protein [Thalassobaculum sp.]|uniref:glycosyltransferase family 4 protein n=1 Tax=Thalassobaculum sp. TaxID=2022740 RepID=UPI0032EB5586